MVRKLYIENQYNDRIKSKPKEYFIGSFFPLYRYMLIWSHLHRGGIEGEIESILMLISRTIGYIFEGTSRSS